MSESEPKAVNRFYADRTDLECRARELLGDSVRFDGASDEQIVHLMFDALIERKKREERRAIEQGARRILRSTNFDGKSNEQILRLVFDAVTSQPRFWIQ